MTIDTAIVEDNKESAKELKNFLLRYGESKGVQFNVRLFCDPLSFFEEYRPEFTLLFLDINMPYMNGMEMAKRLRKIDNQVDIVFVTSLARYATEGYKVGAKDFLIKPVTYEDIRMTLDRLLPMLKPMDVKELVLKNLDGYVRLNMMDVRYVETYEHRLFYHTVNHTVDVWGTLATAEKQLPEDIFVKCGASYLINLHYVTAILGDEVVLGEDRIKMSRAKKKEFIKRFHEYIGGMNGH